MHVRPLTKAAVAAGLAAALMAIPLASPGGAAPSPRQRVIVTLRGAAASGSPASAQAAQAARDRAHAVARSHGARVGHVYRHALNGFSAELSAADVDALRRDARVALVEADTEVTLSTTQTGATWGLDRIDQRNRPLNGTFVYNNTGAGVDAYIIDTGIRLSHNEFGGRAVTGIDLIDGGAVNDCNGHGTHVSGTVGGATYGVAKQVTLIGVRVFACGNSGSTSTIIAGIDWVTGNHQAGQPAVANLSLGGGASTTLDNAVRNMINDGVTAAVAAGNGNALGMPVNSCGQSPARVAQALTIGASSNNDAKASFSNYGTCVDFHAPGVNITSAGIASDSATAVLSGTSMAAPHTAGVAALYLDSNPSASPANVHAALYNNSTKGVITGTGGGLFGGSTPNNHLLFTNY